MADLMRIPTHLANRLLPTQNVNPLQAFAAAFHIRYFGEVTSDLLREYYRQNHTLFWRVVRQLGFYGAQYTGYAYKQFIYVPNPDSATYIWCDLSMQDSPVDPPSNLFLRSQLLELGLVSKGDLVGVTYEALQRIHQSYPFHDWLDRSGFGLCSLAEFCRHSVQEDEPTDATPVGESGHQAAASLTVGRVQLPTHLAARVLKPQEWPECPDVIQALSRAGVTQLGDVLAKPELVSAGLRSLPAHKVMRFQRKLRSIMSNPGAFGPEEVDTSAAALEVFDAVHGDFIEGRISKTEAARRLRNVNRLALLSFGATLQQLVTDARLLAFSRALDEALAAAIAESRWATSSEPSSAARTVKGLPHKYVERFYHTVAAIVETDEERLGAALEPFWSAVGRMATGERPPSVKQAHWELFLRKIDCWVRGHSPTLQEMGEWLGVTRERARQIDIKMDEALAPYSSPLSKLKQFISKPGVWANTVRLIPPDLTHRERNVATELLSRKGIALCGPLLQLEGKGRLQKEVLPSLREYLVHTIARPMFTVDSLREAVEGFTRVHQYPAGVEDVLAALAKDNLCVEHGNYLGWRGASKRDVAVSIFREFESGLALYRDIAMFRARVESEAPGLFESDRALIAGISNSEHVVLWGWGVYIHRDHVHVSKEQLHEVVAWIERRFQRGIPQLSAYAAFAEFQDHLQSVGIPNEHALYSCLRLFYADAFFLPKDPKIFPAGEEQTYRNTDLLVDFLGPGPRSLAALRQEFVERCGWKDFMLSSALSQCEQAIRSGAGQYALRSHFQVTEKDLQSLADYLSQKLAQGLETISIGLLLRDRQAQCYALGLTNPYLLYSLFEAEFGDRFQFPRFPHVARSQALSSQDVSNRKLVEMYLVERQDIVIKEELREEFIRRRGWSERALDNALHSPDILPYTRWTAAEFVHRDVLGWTSAKQEELEAWVRTQMDGIRARRFPFGHVRDLLVPRSLPALANGLPWTEDLLAGFIEDMPGVSLLGTKGAVMAPLPHPAQVESDVDFVAYILRTEFGGAAKLSLLEARLARLEFAKELTDGYLSAVEVPYEQVGDELILREL